MEYHASDPSALIENAFRRIHTERMADMPMLNPALRVAAVGFGRRPAPAEEWLGVLLTPWSLGLMILPAGPDWPAPASHERTFRDFPAGSFAFLPNREEGLGDYLVCPLFHEMSQFVDQEGALATARACLLALELDPAKPAADAGRPTSDARRRFLALGR